MESTNIRYWEKVLKNPTPAYKELLDKEKEYLLKKVPTNSKVLDIGCGDGRNMKTLLAKTKYIFGIDNDEIAIIDAKKNFSSNREINIQKAEATKLPFEDKIFDIIIFFDILQNLGYQKEWVLLEAKRVLRDDGSIILCTYSEDSFEERIKMYEIIHVPIEKIDGTKVFFNKSVGAFSSEQFSLDEINELARKSMLQIVDSQKIGKIAYICVLNRVGI